MEIGISTSSFFTKVATEDTFLYIKQFGAKVCEVFLSSFSEYSGEIGKKIIDNKCVKVHSIHSLTNQYEPELFSANPRAKRDAENILRQVMSMAQKLGAKFYTFHGATRLKQINYNFDYDRLSGILNGISDICKEYSVTLAYENVHWAYFKEPEYFKKLSERCENICATLDIKQAMQANIDYREYLPVVKGKLATCHVCDYNSEKKLSLPGRGDFDFVTFFKEIEDIGFDGAVLMEVYPKDYTNFDELKNSYLYLLEAAAKANVKIEI